VAAARDTQLLPPPATGLFAFVTYSGTAFGGLSLRWTLYDFGKTGNSVDSAEARRNAATSNIAAHELTVASNVANAYVTLAYKEKLRDVSKATLSQRERLAVLAHGLVKAGLQPPLEEIRAQSRADASRRDLATAEADVLDARAVLGSLLGLEPTAIVHVTVPKLPQIDTDAGAAMRAADRLPQVAQARATLESKNSAIDAATARYLPSLQLQGDGSYHFTRIDRSDLILNTRSASGGLVLSGTIFDPSISAGVDAARADAADAAADLGQAKRDARTEAARAAAATSASATALTHAKKAAEDANAVLTVVQARYVQGLSSPLDLIDAESADADARVAFTHAELAHALAVVRLFVATGRSLEEQ
jgi:outer membrane protein TolC